MLEKRKSIQFYNKTKIQIYTKMQFMNIKITVQGKYISHINHSLNWKIIFIKWFWNKMCKMQEKKKLGKTTYTTVFQRVHNLLLYTWVHLAVVFELEALIPFVTYKKFLNVNYEKMGINFFLLLYSNKPSMLVSWKCVIT